MKYALLFLSFILFICSVSFAQVSNVQEQIQTPLGLVPVSTSYQPPPAKTDDVLPIAPMRNDDKVEMPDTIFTSINKNEAWERYERGENLKEGSHSAQMLANKESLKDKGRKPSSIKNNKGSKKVKSKGHLSKVSKGTNGAKGKITAKSSAKSGHKKSSKASKAASKKENVAKKPNTKAKKTTHAKSKKSTNKRKPATSKH